MKGPGAESREPAALTIVGAGTLVPDPSRQSSAHHLGHGAASVLLDCGPGTAHGLARHGIAWPQLTHVAISHFHHDHCGDLPALLFALSHGVEPPRGDPLTLVGPVGLRGLVERLAAAFGDRLAEPGYELHIVEIGPDRPFEDAAVDLTMACTSTPHTAESVAYRLSGSWGSIGYTGDTGPSPDVARFLEGCDVLVAECTFPESEAIDTHLAPSSLAALARIAEPELLVIVHVSLLHAPDEAARAVREAWGGPTVAAWDGLRIRLLDDGPSVDPHPGRP